jgi:hypothetical protein
MPGLQGTAVTCALCCVALMNCSFAMQAGAHGDGQAPAGDGEDEDEALAPHHQANGMWVDQDAADAEGDMHDVC